MLRPCHLFAFDEISHDTYWFMKISGSGSGIVVLYIWMSAKNLVYVSGLATSEEKYTEATMDFSSTSMPAFWQACFTTAWHFWRGALIEVWYTNLSFLPFLARTPSAPFFQPAASSTWFALSMSYSHFCCGERKRGGLARKLRVAIPVRP